MTARARLALAAGAVGLPVAFAPLLLRPQLVFVLAIAVAAVALAARSVVYPIALAGLPAVLVALAGSNPLPPGGIALLTAGWTAVGLAILVVRADDELPFRVLATPAVAATAALAVWLFVRLGSSLDASYGSRKLQLFIALDVVALVAGIVVGRVRDRVDLWAIVALLVSAAGAFALVRGVVGGHATVGVGGRLALTGSDSPIGLSRDAARGLILAVYLLMAGSGPTRRLLAIAAIPLLTIAFVSGGSRGPLLGLLAGLAAFLAYALRDPRARRRVLLVFVAAVVSVPVVGQLAPGQDVGRTFSILTGSEGGLSSNGRSQLWSAAWNAFSSHPLLGIGTGSFHALGGVELYPHNLLLEAAAEWGIVGLALVAITVAAAGKTLSRALRAAAPSEQPQAALVLGLFAAAVVNSMFSGDVTDNAAVWFAGGLAVGIARRVDALPLRLRAAPTRPARQAWTSRQPLRDAPSPPAPAIIRPADGERVAGLVGVEVAVPPLPAGLERVRLQWQREGRWAAVAEADERVFDVVAGGDVVAAVRGEWLAEAIAAGVAGSAVRSRRRPWTAARSVVSWDTSPFVPGPAVIRAVCVDAAGGRHPTPAVRIRLSGPGVEPPGEADPSLALRRAFGSAAELAEREREVRRAHEALRRLRAELEARRRP
ncbi:MAG TPA: O-antigen ligase family protein [Gaiellaceae bacterium]